MILESFSSSIQSSSDLAKRFHIVFNTQVYLPFICLHSASLLFSSLVNSRKKREKLVSCARLKREETQAPSSHSWCQVKRKAKILDVLNMFHKSVFVIRPIKVLSAQLNIMYTSLHLT